MNATATRGRLSRPMTIHPPPSLTIAMGRLPARPPRSQDVVFAGAGEDCCWQFTAMFDAMGALSTQYNDSPETASRAFDKTRDGCASDERGRERRTNERTNERTNKQTRENSAARAAPACLPSGPDRPRRDLSSSRARAPRMARRAQTKRRNTSPHAQRAHARTLPARPRARAIDGRRPTGL